MKRTQQKFYNPSSGLDTKELFERSVAALVREWGVSEEQAREALIRQMAAEVKPVA